MNYDDIYQQFIGKDKIQPLRIEKAGNGEFVLIYKEGRRTHQLKCEDRRTLEQILVEFGGKNPETCKTESRFLELDGSWGADDLLDLGHRVTKISISGGRVLRQKTIPIKAPTGTGSPVIIHAKRHKEDNINLRLIDREDVKFTRSFRDPYELNTLIEFLRGEASLQGLRWRVDLLGTQSRDTQRQCVWQRVQAGDGTRRMVLELRKLDGVDFRRCVRQELFDTAGDMFDAPCKRVTVKRKKAAERDICLFAAEDGKVDLAAYEAAR